MRSLRRIDRPSRRRTVWPSNGPPTFGPHRAARLPSGGMSGGGGARNPVLPGGPFSIPRGPDPGARRGSARPSARARPRRPAWRRARSPAHAPAGRERGQHLVDEAERAPTATTAAPSRRGGRRSRCRAPRARVTSARSRPPSNASRTWPERPAVLDDLPLLAAPGSPRRARPLAVDACPTWAGPETRRPARTNGTQRGMPCDVVDSSPDLVPRGARRAPRPPRVASGQYRAPRRHPGRCRRPGTRGSRGHGPRTATQPPPRRTLPFQHSAPYRRRPDAPGGEDRDARVAHPVRAVHRARRVRVRVRVRHRRPPLARHRPGRPDGPRQPRAPRRHRLRAQHGRRRRDPGRHPARVPRGDGRREAAIDLPAGGGYGVAMVFLPRDAASRDAARRDLRDARSRRGPRAPRLARRPADPRGLGESALGQHARSSARRSSPARPASPAARTRTSPSSAACTSPAAWSRRPSSAAPCPAAASFYVPSMSCRTIVYKGMLNASQLLTFYPDLLDERLRERGRPRPLAVLHQHLPVVGPRAPVPLHQPQRRDQHAARQRQLDVRPPVHVPLVGVRRRPAQGPAGGRRGRLRHRDLRQRARAAPPGRPLARPRDGDDGPRAVEPRRRDVVRRARPSTSTTPA